jgi:hypothetical protein
MRRLITFLLLATSCAFSANIFGSEPVLKKGMFPTYQACAIEKRVAGVVRIKATLASDGKVVRAVPIGKNDKEEIFPELKNDNLFAYQCLCKAAQKAALSWEFEKGSKIKEVVLLFRFELVNNIPEGGDLYPVYIAPFEIQIRGLLPLVSMESGTKKTIGR